ncbi:MAG: amidohydrolase family protein [Pseudomonadota bacterium]
MNDKTLIRAERVFDGFGIKRSQYIVISGDQIIDIGPQSTLSESANAGFDAVVVSGEDQTLLPGLINMHTHLSFSATDRVFENQRDESDATKMIRIVENLHDALAVGITTVRDCGTWPRLANPARDCVESGLLSGPRIVTSGAITTTGGHCWFCAREADNEDELRKAVRSHVKDGVNFIKLFATGGNTTPGSNALVAQYTKEQMCAAVEEANKAGRRTASHAHATDGVRHSIAARVTTIEHCSFQSDAGIGWDDDMVDEIVAAGIYVCPTVFRGSAKNLVQLDRELTAREQAYMTRRQQRYTLTNRLAERGVQLISGNDAGVANCHITDFPGDLVETCIKCELSPSTVLKSATSTAAKALGRSDLGTVEKGKAADLLVVAGDPTTDIAAIGHPILVVARGAPTGIAGRVTT